MVNGLEPISARVLSLLGSRGDAVVRALASHQCGLGLSLLLVLSPTAVKRLGPFFVLFREILFIMEWKHEQGQIY